MLSILFFPTQVRDTHTLSQAEVSYMQVQFYLYYKEYVQKRKHYCINTAAGPLYGIT